MYYPGLRKPLPMIKMKTRGGRVRTKHRLTTGDDDIRRKYGFKRNYKRRQYSIRVKKRKRRMAEYGAGSIYDGYYVDKRDILREFSHKPIASF